MSARDEEKGVSAREEEEGVSAREEEERGARALDRGGGRRRHRGTVAGDWVRPASPSTAATVAPGDLFVALSANRDGHEIVADALANGAVAALVSQVPEGVDPARLLVVGDVMKGARRAGRGGPGAQRGPRHRVNRLGRQDHGEGTCCARRWRRRARPMWPRRASTTTGACRSRWPPARRRDYAVIEIGMNAPGEIAPLAGWPPACGHRHHGRAAHMAAFGAIEGIARERRDLRGLEPAEIALAHADIDTRDRVRRGPRAGRDAAPLRRGRGVEARLVECNWTTRQA